MVDLLAPEFLAKSIFLLGKLRLQHVQLRLGDGSQREAERVLVGIAEHARAHDEGLKIED